MWRMEDGRWETAYLKLKSNAGMMFTRVNMMDE